MDIRCIPTGAFCTNTYIVERNGEAIIIDPGDDLEAIVDYIENNGIAPKHCLITHGHFDHVAAVAGLKDKYDLDIFMPEADHRNIAASDFYDAAVGVVIPHFLPDRLLVGGERLTLLGYDIEVMSVPGHTPGCMCYIFDDEVMFSGDTIFRGSIGRWDLPHGNYRELLDSLRKILALKKDYIIYPGHGESTTLDRERKNKMYEGL